MPFNGSGTFTGVGGGDFPAVAGEIILASSYNAVINDIIDGLTNCLTRDGQSPATANIPMATKRITGLGDAVGAQDATTLTQVQTLIAAVALSTLLPMTVVSGVSQTATANNHYVLTNASLTNVTLPAGSAGSIVVVTVANGLATNTITPNGTEEIEGSNTAMTLDITAGSVWLRYVDNTKDWRLM
jgi:hypothetical protein